MGCGRGLVWRPWERLFYTQGDYGLSQCSEPCHDKTYDNYDTVKRMVEEQRDMRVPTELVPHCPVCGKPMGTNLRADVIENDASDPTGMMGP